MSPRPAVLASVPLLYAACTAHDNASLTIVRDSAGVVIAESPLEASGNEWRLRSPPVLVIGRGEGTADGPDLFGYINHVIRLSSGQIAVAEGLVGEIRVFDEGGGHLRTFGGSGEGPGEFAILGTIAELPGDTIVAVDPLGGRISLFTSLGRFVRSFPVPRLPEASAPNVIGWLEGGTLLVAALTRSPSSDTRDQSTHVLYSIDRAGEVTETLGQFAGQPLGSNGLGLAFGARAHFATGGNLAWYGHSSRFELVGRDRSGSVRRIVRAERNPRTVTQAEIDESRAAAAEQLRVMSGPAVDRIRATEFASNHPVHGRLLFDEAGNLWVERYPSDPNTEGAMEWDIFDEEGRLTGSLTTPSGFRITYIGSRSVLGVHADSLGIETVRMYRLDR